MVTAWPKNLPGPGVAAQLLADRITTLSGGRIEVKLFAAGEIVPGNGVFDAVGRAPLSFIMRSRLLGFQVQGHPAVWLPALRPARRRAVRLDAARWWSGAL
jgi:hypothetical protein